MCSKSTSSLKLRYFLCHLFIIIWCSWSIITCRQRVTWQVSLDQPHWRCFMTQDNNQDDRKYFHHSVSILQPVCKILHNWSQQLTLKCWQQPNNRCLDLCSGNVNSLSVSSQLRHHTHDDTSTTTIDIKQCKMRRSPK